MRIGTAASRAPREHLSAASRATIGDSEESPGKTRPLGIPSVYDRVRQQALVNRLEPIFEKVFDPSSFGYRKGRKTADALSKIWREVETGNEWIVDADLKDFFGSVDHEKLRPWSESKLPTAEC